MQATEFHLRRQDFTDVPHLLAATDGLKVTTFRYATGVEALQWKTATAGSSYCHSWGR